MQLSLQASLNAWPLLLHEIAPMGEHQRPVSALLETCSVLQAFLNCMHR